jgi:hypothetical protein
LRQDFQSACATINKHGTHPELIDYFLTAPKGGAVMLYLAENPSRLEKIRAMPYEDVARVIENTVLEKALKPQDIPDPGPAPLDNPVSNVGPPDYSNMEVSPERLKVMLRDTVQNPGRMGSSFRRHIAPKAFEQVPDLEVWAGRKWWSMQEATALMLGLDPEYVTWWFCDAIAKDVEHPKLSEHVALRTQIYRQWECPPTTSLHREQFLIRAADLGVTELPEELQTVVDSIEDDAEPGAVLSDAADDASTPEEDETYYRQLSDACGSGNDISSPLQAKIALSWEARSDELVEDGYTPDEACAKIVEEIDDDSFPLTAARKGKKNIGTVRKTIAAIKAAKSSLKNSS